MYEIMSNIRMLMNNLLTMHFWSEEISSPMRLAQTQRNGDTNDPPNPLPNVQLTPLPPNQPTILIRPPPLLLLMSLESCQQRDVYQSGLTTFAAPSPIFCWEYFSEYFLSSEPFWTLQCPRDIYVTASQTEATVPSSLTKGAPRN